MSRPKLFGFDIETYDHDNKFLCASIVGDGYERTFFDRRSVIEEFKHRRFRKAKVVATNLAYDFFGTFEGEPEMAKFDTLFRGSDLIYAKTRIFREGFSSERKRKGGHSLTFIDTMSFCPFSVEKLGKVIGYPKMKYPQFLTPKFRRDDKRDMYREFYDFYQLVKDDPGAQRPDFIGRRPKTQEELDYLVAYNINDCRVSLKFMQFLYDSFHTLGANVRNTIASTSMSLFRNRFLKDSYPLLRTPLLLDIFQSYYGGRTEAISRGRVEGRYYYGDVNSLYPAMALNDMPDPRHTYVTETSNTEYIEKYLGVSDVDIIVPDNQMYPCLPNRVGKVVFGHGRMRGWWTHAELKQAMDDGAEIQRIYKTIYFPAVCRPFDEFVRTLYSMRLKFKAEGNPMELVVKMLLNSLTGKFGQKFIGRDNYTPFDGVEFEDIEGMDDVERIGGFIRTTKDSDPSSFCQPHWISYITAYGRLHLLRLMRKHHAIYCDTDSIITMHDFDESKELGGLKKEMTISEGVIVRPKFYAFRGSMKGEAKDVIRLKGLGWQPDYAQFSALVNRNVFRDDGGWHGYSKFVRIKEAMRRNMKVNSVIPISKDFSVEDDKRRWPAAFSPFEFQTSAPQEIINGMTRIDHDERMAKAMLDWDRQGRMKMTEFINSDLFDRFSVGADITAEDHLRLEMYHGRMGE